MSRYYIFPAAHDYTALQDWQTCPQKYAFRHLMGLRSPGAAPAPLAAGKLAHVGWRTRMLGQPWKCPPFNEDRKRTPYEVDRILDAYFEVYPVADDCIEWEDFEVYFTLDLPSGHRREGVLDAIGRFRDTRHNALMRRVGELCFLDLKTTSMRSFDAERQFAISDQMTGYAWALNELRGRAGRPIWAVVNVLQVGTRADALARDIAWRVEVLKTSDDFTRFFRNTRSCEEEIARVDWTLDDPFLVRGNTGACFQYFSRCPYYDVCASPRDADLLIETQFERRAWKPAEKEKDE